ncbi:unnamed protein product [Phytophthora fragariaefolia]|uniref:Unnamed protein product n=1 Tax=Phytophthora fragariaefolia TaxID=1490495 RepID=A0A9W6YBK1_9STRA|nr:unnamed protein product [Phytophthora fragariaefolia]
MLSTKTTLWQFILQRVQEQERVLRRLVHIAVIGHVDIRQFCHGLCCQLSSKHGQLSPRRVCAPHEASDHEETQTLVHSWKVSVAATMDLTEDEDGYNSSEGSVDEDAELELSCALHDLALRVKTFEANMQGRFKQDLGGEEEEEEEITEDIDHFEEEVTSSFCGQHRMDSDSASPKRRGSRRRRSSGFKAAKHQNDDEVDGDSEDFDSSEDERPEAKSGRDGSELSEDEEWDSQEEKEELCELKQNIAKLLQSMQEEAKALEDNQADCKAVL